MDPLGEPRSWFAPQFTATVAAVACTVILGLAGLFQNLSGARFTQTKRTAGAVSLFRQMEALKADPALPRPFKKVGYVTDMTHGEKSDATRFLVQYSLVPALCVPGRPFPSELLDPAVRPYWHLPHSPAVNTEWLVGVFESAAGRAAVLSRGDLTVVREYGEGVVLLRRVAK
jgi:hypothetical protein